MDMADTIIFFTLLFVSVFMTDCAALQQDVQVKLGEDVTLQCQIPKNETISVLKWSRADLNTDGYVYFNRENRSYENYQHPSFHARVKLRNPEMKDGDVSLILENVTFNDAGIYECHIAVKNSGRSERAHTEISHFINLTVTGETHANILEKTGKETYTNGNVHSVVKGESQTVQSVIAVAVAAVVVVVAFAGVWFFKPWRSKRKKKKPAFKPSAEIDNDHREISV